MGLADDQKIGTNIPCISTTDLWVRAHALTKSLWFQLNVKYSIMTIFLALLAITGLGAVIIHLTHIISMILFKAYIIDNRTAVRVQLLCKH